MSAGAAAVARTSFILSPEETQLAGVEATGGKASGLARLAQAGAKVPPFFTVAGAAFTAHLSRNGLHDKIAGVLAGLASSGAPPLARLEEISRELRDAVEAVPLDPAVDAGLKAALARLGSGPVAVRSSMVGEDSAQHSFAGQLDSYLFQRTAAEVAASLVRCWSSAFTARALAYRLRIGSPEAVPVVGVVVQRMIAGQVSGVLFTAHPTSGRRDQALLTATYGQGEGLVSGHCNADEYVWAHDAAELSAVIAHKDVELGPDPSGKPGTVETAVPEARRDARCLTLEQVSAICGEGVRIARAFGAPQDVEWTIADGTLYLLQARPITSLAAPPAEDGPRVVWDNSNIQESYCGVTTPLTFSFAVSAYANVYEQLLRVLGLPHETIETYRPVLRHMLGLVRGRVYYNINNWYRVLLILPGFGRNKQDMERMMGLDSPVDFVEDLVLSTSEKLRRVPRLVLTLLRMKRRFAKIDAAVAQFLADFEAAYRRVDRREFATASVSRLMEIREQLKREIMGNWHTPIINDFYVMMASGKLRRLIERTMGADAQRLLANLMCGEDGIASTEPTRMLMRMAQTARGDATLAADLRAGTPHEALARMRAHHPAFAATFDDYIERFGDRCMGELKLETISLREDSGFVVQALRNYLDRPDLDPDRLADKEKVLRADAEREVRAKLGFGDRRALAGALKHARKAVKYRENMRLARTRGFGLYRDLHRALGDRLHEAGKLDAARDVFYLTVDEIDGFFDGTAVSAELRPLVRARQAEFAAYETLELPHRFDTRGAVHLGNQYLPTVVVPVETDARILRGTGCYPGIVEAPARVILSPHDDLSINGKILVTLRTDPGWAPLFPTSSGILVERGSTLSHSAVLARELGIPAIVGVPNLLKIVRDGEQLRLDGAAGTVERKGS